jgi:hypothetical protein
MDWLLLLVKRNTQIIVSNVDWGMHERQGNNKVFLSFVEKARIKRATADLNQKQPNRVTMSWWFDLLPMCSYFSVFGFFCPIIR